jgi:hypothetical protein
MVCANRVLDARTDRGVDPTERRRRYCAFPGIGTVGVGSVVGGGGGGAGAVVGGGAGVGAGFGVGRGAGEGDVGFAVVVTAVVVDEDGVVDGTYEYGEEIV